MSFYVSVRSKIRCNREGFIKDKKKAAERSLRRLKI